MATKGYSTLTRSPKLEPLHQMQFNVMSRTPSFGVGLPLLHGMLSVYSKPHRQGGIILSTGSKSSVWLTPHPPSGLTKGQNPLPRISVYFLKLLSSVGISLRYQKLIFKCNGVWVADKKVSPPSSKIKFRKGGCPRGVMVKAMVCGVVVSEFELQSRCYVRFQTNALEKSMNPPYPSS